MNKPLEGKHSLVTGASRGIGAAIAKRLAADGATVTLTYVGSKANADEVVKEIVDAGGTARAVKADASVRGDGAKAVAEVLEQHGSLEILVSNAGINISKPIDLLTDADY
ncbi:MAG: SDR family NAD(P)-dependent oxidoreductase, partial [Planctomycetota bacterium]